MQLRNFPLCSLLAGTVLMLSSSGASFAAEPIRVALVSRTLFNMPAWVAERKGFLQQTDLFSLQLTERRGVELKASLRRL